MTDLFKDIIPSILQTKTDVLVDGVSEKVYAPFVVNKALSYHADCVLYANEMNANYMLDVKMQYDYLRHSVRSKKRPFNQWIKKEKESDLEAIKLYFGYSTRAARDVLSVLSEGQLKFIREQTRID
jgi:hypothetical protein